MHTLLSYNTDHKYQKNSLSACKKVKKVSPKHEKVDSTLQHLSAYTHMQKMLPNVSLATHISLYCAINHKSYNTKTLIIYNYQHIIRAINSGAVHTEDIRKNTVAPPSPVPPI